MYGKQKKLDKNKNNKLDKEDFKLLRMKKRQNKRPLMNNESYKARASNS